MITRHDRFVGSIVGAALFMLGASVVIAHHSVYGNFDIKRLVEVRGQYVGADMVNPHAWFHFNEVDANGKLKQDTEGKPIVWSFETPGPSALRRTGISPSLFKQGDVYTVYAPPALDGSNKGLFLLTIFPDGRRLFIGNPKDPLFAPLADKINASAAGK